MKITFDYSCIQRKWDDTEIDRDIKNDIEVIVSKNFIKTSQNRFFAEGNGLLIVGTYNDTLESRIVSIARVSTLIIS